MVGDGKTIDMNTIRWCGIRTSYFTTFPQNWCHFLSDSVTYSGIEDGKMIDRNTIRWCGILNRWYKIL